MRVLLTVFLLVVSCGDLFASDCPGHYYRGLEPVLINQKMMIKAKELCNLDYAVYHSGITHTPLYAVEHLTRAKLDQAKGLPRVNNFRPDPRLRVGERSELRDFVKSGFDRGHLAASANMSSADAQDESFLLSNMIPQTPVNNRGLHEAIERVVRNEVKKRGELYVVTGVIFPKERVMTLKGKVFVPAQIYKAIYDPKRREAAAYFEYNGSSLNYKVISIKELANLAEIDVFPGVSVDIKSRAVDLPVPKIRRHEPAGEL